MKILIVIYGLTRYRQQSLIKGYVYDARNYRCVLPRDCPCVTYGK